MTAITYEATRRITSEHTRLELVINGEMNSSTGWTLGANWAISGGLLTHTPGSIATASQNTTLVNGYIYVVNYQVTGRTAGSVTINVGGDADTARSADGLYAYNATATTNGFTITPTSDFDGSIDNMSIILTPTWSMDVVLVARDLGINVNKTTHESLSGTNTETIFHNYTERYRLTTTWIDYPDLVNNYWDEFIYSVIGGEDFTIDLRGTVAVPDDPRTAIMLGSPSYDSRPPDYHKISFEVLLK